MDDNRLDPVHVRVEMLRMIRAMMGGTRNDVLVRYQSDHTDAVRIAIDVPMPVALQLAPKLGKALDEADATLHALGELSRHGERRATARRRPGQPHRADERRQAERRVVEVGEKKKTPNAK